MIPKEFSGKFRRAQLRIFFPKIQEKPKYPTMAFRGPPRGRGTGANFGGGGGRGGGGFGARGGEFSRKLLCDGLS